MARRGPSPEPAPRLRALTLVVTLLLLSSPSLSDAAAASPSPSPSPSPAPAPLRSPPRQVASASDPRAIPPPPSRHHRAHRRGPPPPPPPKPKRRLNFGERLGIALAGVAVAMQLVLGAFLAVRARQLRLPEAEKAEGEAASSSSAPPA